MGVKGSRIRPCFVPHVKYCENHQRTFGEKADDEPCPRCDGEGHILAAVCGDESDLDWAGPIDCSKCGGSGRVPKKDGS